MVSFKEIWPWNEFERFLVFGIIRLKTVVNVFIGEFFQSFTFLVTYWCSGKFLKEDFQKFQSEVSVSNHWQLSPAYDKFIYLLAYISICSVAGKSIFLRNVIKEIRPGCRNLQRWSLMINLSEIFLVGMV